MTNLNLYPRMKYAATALIALVIALIGVPQGTAHACSVMAGWPPSAQEFAATQDLIFAGTVESVIQDKSVYGDYRITFAVKESDKGTSGETVTLRAPGSSAACGYDDGYGTFKKGENWVIYATGSSTEGYSTNAIGLNAKYSSLNDAVEKLRAIGMPVSSAIPTEDLWLGKGGESVTWLQKQLILKNTGEKAQALGAVGATGYFGPLTRAALIEYQTTKGITPAFGYFGAKTHATFEVALKPEISENIPQNGKVSIEGKTTCLPPKNTTGPVIAMCALGLEGTDGNFYALSYDDAMDAAGTEGTLRVEGTFTSGTQETWKSVGTIAVKSISEVK